MVVIGRDPLSVGQVEVVSECGGQVCQELVQQYTIRDEVGRSFRNSAEHSPRHYHRRRVAADDREGFAPHT